MSTSEMARMATRAWGRMISPMCQRPVGTEPAGNRTGLAPSSHSHDSQLPARLCSTRATKIRARPMVEMRGAMSGASRRRRGRSATISMKAPSRPQTAMATGPATQIDQPCPATRP